MQVITLSAGNEATTLSHRYLIGVSSASAHNNANTSSVIASGGMKKAGEPNLADPTKKSVRGGVSYIPLCFFLHK